MIGSAIGPYQIIDKVGEGGMGEVYRARDPRLGRDVAIKVLPAAFASDADRLRRFEQEARAAAALNHPNILALYDIGMHPADASGAAIPYIVPELLDGESLRERLQHGPSGLPIRRVTDYAVQITRGLAAAHEQGIIHRDLKPDNVYVTSDDAVKLLDFGLEPGRQGTVLSCREAEFYAHGSHHPARPGLLWKSSLLGQCSQPRFRPFATPTTPAMVNAFS